MQVGKKLFVWGIFNFAVIVKYLVYFSGLWRRWEFHRKNHMNSWSRQPGFCVLLHCGWYIYTKDERRAKTKKVKKEVHKLVGVYDIMISSRYDHFIGLCVFFDFDFFDLWICHTMMVKSTITFSNGWEFLVIL